MADSSSKERVATDHELRYLLECAEKDIRAGVPLDSHLIAASLVGAICRELLERRSQPETGDEVVARGGDRCSIRLDNGELCSGELVAIHFAQKTGEAPDAEDCGRRMPELST